MSHPHLQNYSSTLDFPVSRLIPGFRLNLRSPPGAAGINEADSDGGDRPEKWPS
ncbi:MAG: hypothetical protein AAF773_21605 [Cyanobacteria bacterium P01_D01_bin.115]